MHGQDIARPLERVPESMLIDELLERLRKLREHFEVNRHYVVVAALKALAEEGSVPAAKVAEAIAKYGINAEKINPLYA